jgi:two-component system, chemotaxis family, sensor kinase CheA
LAGDDRFRTMFYEEARELLISLEEGLLELERRQGDRAHLDRTFRAAHSLKGAAAMVGLPAIAEFTHHMEAVLERIRAGKLGIDSDLTSTLLEARDQLAAMVESEAVDAPIPAPVDLVQRLIGLLSEAPRVAPKPPPPPSPPAPPPPVENVKEAETKEKAPEPPPVKPKARVRKPRPKSSKSGEAATPDRATAGQGGGDHAGKAFYRIAFKPGPETLRRGVNPLGVLDELSELGPTVVTTDPNLVPPLDELDPERCYLAWNVDVVTDAPRERVDDVFLFVAEDSVIDVAFHSSSAAATPKAAAPKPVPVTSMATVVALSRPTLTFAVEPSSPAPAIQVAMPPPPSPPRVATPAAGAASPAPRSSPRIRVDADQLDDLVGLAGELAVLSDNLQGLREIPGAAHWVHTLEALERVSRQVRDTTLDLRMVPVDELFSRFPRVIRDLADRFGKEIELRIIGQDTKLDRTIVEKLSDPMIHLIRNAVDHALETPDERLAKGKSRKGRVSLSAGHEGDRVAIRVEDDGRGLDREKIVRKGVAVGLVPVGTSADDPRVDNLIFEPGFSTSDKVSDLSGRGVGLDVVRDAVRALRGSLAVESTPGKGTSFIFRLPLTLALIDGLLVETGGARYVVPLAQVEECVALDGSKPALSKGRPCVAVRGELVPMVPLRKVFRTEGEPPARQELLLTRHHGQRVGVAVDRLLGRVQAVIQALGEGLSGLNRFSGATILGDGSVSLILDLAALVTESRMADQHSYSYHQSIVPDGGRPEGSR